MSKSVPATNCIVSLLALSMIGCASNLPEIPAIPGVSVEQSRPQASELPSLPAIPSALSSATSEQARELPPAPELPSATALPSTQRLSSTAQLSSTQELSAPTRPSSTTGLASTGLSETAPPLSQQPEEPTPSQTTSVLQQTVDQNEVIALAPRETLIQQQTAESSNPATTSDEQDLMQVTIVEVTSTPINASTLASNTFNTDTSIEVELTEETVQSRATSNSPMAFVATDLVNALMYIPSMSPSLTFVTLPSSGSNFDELVKSAMGQAGYDIFNTNDTNNKRVTTTLVEIVKSPQLRELTATIAIDVIQISRKYTIQNNNATPVTSYFARGIDRNRVDSRGPLIPLR